MFRSKILIPLLLGAVYSVQGLRCYTCTMTTPDGVEPSPDNKDPCIVDPDNVPGKPVTICPSRMKYCTIVRNDIKSTGAVTSMERNCAENPVIIDGDIESDVLISHYRSCTTDLCNSGLGIEDPNNGQNDGIGAGGMVVPGRSSASTLIHKTLFVFISIVVLNFA